MMVWSVSPSSALTSLSLHLHLLQIHKKRAEKTAYSSLTSCLCSGHIPYGCILWIRCNGLTSQSIVTQWVLVKCRRTNINSLNLAADIFTLSYPRRRGCAASTNSSVPQTMSLVQPRSQSGQMLLKAQV